MKQTLEEAAIAAVENHYGMDYDGKIHEMYILREAFEAGAQWMGKQSPWISIKDKLPEPGQEVFLYDKDSVTHYAVGWLRKKKRYCESGWFVTDGYVTDESITHWMPIEKPID